MFSLLEKVSLSLSLNGKSNKVGCQNLLQNPHLKIFLSSLEEYVFSAFFPKHFSVVVQKRINDIWQSQNVAFVESPKVAFVSKGVGWMWGPSQ